MSGFARPDDSHAEPLDAGGSPTAAATATEPGPAPPALAEPGRRMRATTAGAVVLLGLLGANAANAVFHLVAARLLGPSRYGDLATLVALIGLLSFPLGGVQFALAQRIAQVAARGDVGGIATLYRRSLRWAGALGATLFLVMGATSLPIQHGLRVASLGAVLLTAATLVPTIVAPVVAGLTQGLERFTLFSVSQVIGPLIRIALLLPLIGLGAGVPGAVGATFGATLVAVGGTAWILREWVRAPVRAAAFAATETIRRSLLTSTSGILALTSLTSIDIVFAKVTLAPREAGVYGAASLVGRLILFLPTAVASVLLPKVSSRKATGRDTRTLVVPSLVITGILCLLMTGVYAVVPNLITRLTFGSKYAQAGSWLWMFGLEMTCFALANVSFAYELGRERTRGAWLLVGAAVVQICGYLAFHGSARQLLAVNIATGVGLLVVYGGIAIRTSRTGPAIS
jgi:O-antigen/teichoic acid export membrane protein